MIQRLLLLLFSFAVSPSAIAGNLSVFELTGSDIGGDGGLWKPNIQSAYPQVDWQTLDVLCLPAGQLKFILIGNLPERTAERPLTITNCAGQTRVGGLGHYYLFVLGGGSHWRLTGKYSPSQGTGHPDFPGHADGQYANSHGRYGILIDNESTEEGGPSGLAIGQDNLGRGATDFEIDFIEIRRVGFAGMLIKSDDNGAATMRNVRIHDNYAHDTGSEGIYIGSTQAQPQHSIDGLKFYNNRILRTGTEIFQLGQIGPDTEVYNNVFLAGAMDWKSPFQNYQDNATQLSPRFGSMSFRNNIVIGAASAWINYLGADVAGDDHSAPAVIDISNNYFSGSRRFGAYIARMTQPGMTTRIAQNWFRHISFQYDEIDTGASNFNQFFRLGSGSTANTSPIEFFDNQFDGSQFFINQWADPNQCQGIVSATGNTAANIPAVRFHESGFGDEFDWLRLEIWTDRDHTGAFVEYLQGDVVSVNGSLFECMPAGGCAAGLEPTKPENYSVWRALPAPADDVRVSWESAIQGVGLLDGTQVIFKDQFEDRPLD